MFAILSVRLLLRQKPTTGNRNLFTNVRRKRSSGFNSLQLTNAKGSEFLRNPKLNKELAFTLDERQNLGVHGLLPAAIRNQDEQSELCKLSLDKFSNDLNKCIYLHDLQERNEKLFYRVLSDNIAELLPIVYTPTINQVCEKYGLMFNQPRGLFISIYDRGHISDVLMNWEETDVRAVVVTDGERLINVGDIGAHAMGLPVGKTALYTALGGVKPHQCLPVTLDVGTNNEKLLKDPLYVGLRHHRTIGPTYELFIDEFVDAIIDRFGSTTVIQFEGFSHQNSLEFLQKYKKKCCAFSDEFQSVGALALAGFLASETILNKSIKDFRFLFLGADESTFAIANMTVKHLQKAGLSAMEAKNKMWIFDEYGLLARSRSEGPLTGDKLIYAKDFDPNSTVVDVIKRVKPNVLVGTCGTTNLFTPEVLYSMAKINLRPLVFALSAPGSKNECAAEDVYHHTQGRAVFASGSAVPNQEIYSKNCSPGQINSCFVYPGVVLGTIASGLRQINDDIFPLVARCIADNVTDEDLQVGRVFPHLDKAKECSIDIATKICNYAYDEGIATYYPEPQDKRAFIQAHLYDHDYAPVSKHHWDWPEMQESSMEQAKKEYYGRMKDYFMKFNKSPPTFALEEVEAEKADESKEDLAEIKIVERLPPDAMKTEKPDSSA